MSNKLKSIIFHFVLFTFLCFGIWGSNELLIRLKLLKINLASLLISPGDLPPKYLPGKIEELYHNMRGNYVVKSQEIITIDGDRIGSVTVYLFSDPHLDIDTLVYMTGQVESQEGILPYEVFGIGEAVESFSTNYSRYLGFTRCHALAIFSIDLNRVEDYGIENLINHARHLDERLKAVACFDYR